MKTKYAIAASLLISISAFAQKDELKALKKISNKEKPTPEDMQEFKQLLDKAEPLIANADDRQKADFYYYKGTYSLGQALATSNKKALDTAIESLDKVLEIEKNGKQEYTKEIKEMIYPEVEATVLKIAGELGKQSKFKEAVTLYETAYKLDKRDTLNLYNAAAYAVNAQDYDTALKHFQELERLGFTGSSLNYTAKNNETGQVEYFADSKTRDLYIQAKTHSNPGIHREPSRRPDIIKNIALIYIHKGDNANAMKAIEKAKKENPGDIGMMQAEAQIYLETKDYDSYKRVVKEILDKGSTDPNLYFNLGVTTASSGNIEEAMQYYEKAIQLNPKFTSAYYNLGILELHGEDKLVNEMNSLGTSSKEMKRYDELKKQRDDKYRKAITHLEKAHQIEPDNQDVITLLGNLYMGLEMMDKYNALKKK